MVESETSSTPIAEGNTARKKQKKVSLPKLAIGSEFGEGPDSTRSTPTGDGSSSHAETAPALQNPSFFAMDSARSSSSTASQYSKYFNSSKRPRGRPPLSGKKTPSSTSLTPMQFSSRIPSIKFEPDSFTTLQQQPVTPAKTTPRPPFKIVTKKVFLKLMTSDPVTLDELCELLSECPRDMIATVVDVLTAMSIAQQRTGGDGTAAPVISLWDFARFASPIAIEKLQEEIDKRIEDCNRVEQRLDRIQSLITQENLTVKERKRLLQQLVAKFMKEDPSLKTSPIYTALVQSFGNN